MSPRRKIVSLLLLSSLAFGSALTAQVMIVPKAKPWVGLYLAARQDGLVEVQEVVPDSPAAKAGLKTGDCILALDGSPAGDLETLIRTIQDSAVGKKHALRVLRGEEKLNLEVTLGVDPSAPKPPGGAKPVVPAVPALPLVPAQKAGKMVELKQAGDLEKLIAGARQANQPVLLFFSSSWCGPGRILQEQMKAEPLAGALAGYLVVSIDVDAHSAIADRHGVDGLPHLEVVGPDGRVLGKHVGGADPAKVADLLRKFSAQAGGQAKDAQPARTRVARPAAQAQKDQALDRQILEELRQIRILLQEIREAVRR